MLCTRCHRPVKSGSNIHPKNRCAMVMDADGNRRIKRRKKHHAGKPAEKHTRFLGIGKNALKRQAAAASGYQGISYLNALSPGRMMR
jgi:hypothetical protein